jgi:hypothetical protein
MSLIKRNALVSGKFTHFDSATLDLNCISIRDLTSMNRKDKDY